MEHRLFRAVAGLIERLPEAGARWLGGALGSFVGRVLRIRRRDVETNLRKAFPDRDEAWRRRVARECYRHLGREGVAMLRLAQVDREGLIGRTEVVGLDRVREALRRGRGAVIVTGHLGNWEVGGAAVAARGVDLSAVAIRQANPLFHRDLARTRERLGMRIVYKKDAPADVLRALRAGRAVALLADQNPIRGGIPVEFFGRPANTARGPAVLALRSDAPVFLGVALAEPGSEARYRVVLQEVPVRRSGDLEDDVHELVQTYTRELEAWVRRHPEQYFWHHRRWKERS